MPPVRRQRGTFLGATLHFSTELYKLPDGGDAVKKASKPPSSLNPSGEQLWTENAAEFYRGAIAQGEIAKAGYSPHKSSGRKKVTFVVPILELAPPEEQHARNQDSFSCHRPYLTTNLKAQLETAWRPTHRELFEIVCGIVAGLHQIRLHAKRGHGNLKLSNVLLGSLTGGEDVQAHLTDFRWPATADLGAEERIDMHALARLLYELVVLGRPLKEEEMLPPGAVRRSERWSEIDPERGPLWCELCNRLKNTERRSITLDELRFELERLDPGEPVPWKRSSSLGSSLAEGLASLATLLRTRAAIGTAAMLLVVGLGFGAWKSGVFRGKEKDSAPSQRNSEKATAPKVDGSTNGSRQATRPQTPPTNVPAIVNNTTGKTAVALRTPTNSPVTTQLKSSPGTLSIRIVPTNGIVELGSPVTFHANAQGFSPKTWEWYGPNNRLIGYATGSELTITNVTLTNEGAYYVVANQGQSDGTNSAAILLGIKPTIKITVTNNTLVEGMELSATAEVSPDDATGYQWLANGEPIPNETRKRLNYKPKDPFELSFRAIRGKVAGVSRSFPIAVSKLVPETPAPKILWPTNETRLDYMAGAPTTWTIRHIDASNAHWVVNGTTSTSSNFTPSANFGLTGYVTLRAVALNGGKQTSNIVSVRQVAPPKIVGLTNLVLELQGASTNLQVVANGTERMSYNWFSEGGKSPLPNATGTSYVAKAAGKYHVEVSNAWGKTQMTFDVKQPPTKIAEPSTQPTQFIETIEKNPVMGIYANIGSEKTITIPNATSESMWFLKDELVNKGPSYVIKTVGIENAGEYSVKTPEAKEFKFSLWVQARNQLGMEFVWVPDMPNGGLWVGKHEVSEEEYSLVMSNTLANPTVTKQLPATKLGLNDISRFCDSLANYPLNLIPSTNPNNHFRIPRAEEFASFAGSWADISPKNVVFKASDNGPTLPEPVRGRPPNRKGLTHVYGNVAEALNNPTMGTGPAIGRLGHGQFIVKGGSFAVANSYFQLNRQDTLPTAGTGQHDAGFRVVYGHE